MLRSVGSVFRSLKLLVRFVKRLECVIAHLLKILEAPFQQFDRVLARCFDAQIHRVLRRMRQGVTAGPHAGAAEERRGVRKKYSVIKLNS